MIYRKRRVISYIVIGGSIGIVLFSSCWKKDSGKGLTGSESAVRIGNETFYLEIVPSLSIPGERRIAIVFIKERDNSSVDREELKKVYIENLNKSVRFAILEGDWGDFIEYNIVGNGKEMVSREFCEVLNKLRGESNFLFVVWLGNTWVIPFECNLITKCFDGMVLVGSDVQKIDDIEYSGASIPMLIFIREGDSKTEAWAANLCGITKSLCEFRTFASVEESAESIVFLDTARQLLLDWISTISNTTLN